MKIIIALSTSQDQDIARELYLRHPLDVIQTPKRLIIKSDDVINSLFKLTAEKSGIISGLIKDKQEPEIFYSQSPYKGYRIKYADGFISPIIFADEKEARDHLKKMKGGKQ